MKKVLLGLILVTSLSSFATEVNTEIVEKIKTLGWKVTLEDTPKSENECLNEQLKNTLAVLSRSQCLLLTDLRKVHIYGETSRRVASGVHFSLQIGKDIPGIAGHENGLHIKYTRVKYKVGRTEISLSPPYVSLPNKGSTCKIVSEEDIEEQLDAVCYLNH